MKVINLYILKNFLKFFIIGLVLFCFILLTTELFNILPHIIKNKISVFILLKYLILRLPYNFILATPISLLFTSLLVFGLLCKNREIIAIVATGTNPLKLIVQIGFMACIFTLFSFLILCFFIPQTNRACAKVEKIIKKHNKYTQTNISVKLKKDIFLYAKEFDKIGKKFIDLRLDILRPDSFNINKTIIAKKCVHYKDKWYLIDCVLRKFSKDGMLEKETRHELLEFSLLTLSPDELWNMTENPSIIANENNLISLYRLISSKKKIRFDTQGLEVELHTRIAFCFSNIIMVILGSSCGLYFGVLGCGISMSFGICVVVSLVYWLALAIFRALGYTSLHPLLAAWTPNILFTLISISVIYKLNKRL